MECTTLWNNQGNSDKIYQVIVSPHEYDNETKWDVYARYGRRNKELQIDIKAEGINLPIAQAMARNLIHSKLNRGYRVSADAAPVPEENYLRIRRMNMDARRQANDGDVPPPAPVGVNIVKGEKEKPAMAFLQKNADFQALKDTNWPLQENGAFPQRLEGIRIPKVISSKYKVEDIEDKENYLLSLDWWNMNHYACVNGKAMAWDMWGNPTIMLTEAADFLKRVEKATGPIAFTGEIIKFPFREIVAIYVMSWKVFGGKDLRGLKLNEIRYMNSYFKEAIQIAEKGNNKTVVKMTTQNNVMGKQIWRSYTVRSPKKHKKYGLIIFDNFGNPLAFRSPMIGRRIEYLNPRMG
jgi:hypothetical protein